MKLQNIYKSDINRDINGVIKVAQDDDRSLKQELSEYIITKELRRHFNTFLTNYERSLSSPTDKIGVWISGFFGSGKSHFLKMLSYLLSNKEAAGKKAVDYFCDKFDDPMMFAQLERCASVPTDTILFNIDSKSSINKDKTAILRVFAKVFYEHLGFYGDDLKFARLEQFISKSGKTEEFKEKFSEINGGDWDDTRDAIAFFEDDVVETLMSVLSMSETAARNWFNGTETADISISQLVGEIKEYIDSRGSDYRLLFMIDEVGQYIGSDSDLMLNLQTIVEEIGTKCSGRVWVMVTSQEAIDSITKISGDDFSKIQGRFNTRLSLSSSSVDEVIQKRILAKNDNGETLMRMSYEKNGSVLRNLFSFTDSVLDLKGFAGETEFVTTYPFVPYQFRLMQNVLAQIRKHGNSGKHLSGGERSMLSGFQEAAQAIQDRDENALVPFYLFYNTVHTFLEGTIRRVIDRCQAAADAGDGIDQYDVNVLKLLYLIRYIDDIKSCIDNITILMTDDIRTDKIDLRSRIQRSLDNLISQNYISRSGDVYTFLTDDEQDIAREIRNTLVDSSALTSSIAHDIFGDMYQAKKFRYGKYDFPFDRIVDEYTPNSYTGAIRLRIVTAASEMYGDDRQSFILKSSVDNEAIIVLSDKVPYFEELEAGMKIRKYVKGRNVTQLPEAIQSIIRMRQQQASVHEKNAKGLLAEAIVNGTFYVAGEELVLKGGSYKDKIESALSALVESVYSKLNLVQEYCESDEDIVKILTDKTTQLSFGGISAPNAEAVGEIEQYLERQSIRRISTSMGDIQKQFQSIPYGWREIDIAALVASLITAQKITIRHSGEQIQPQDSRLPEYLRRKTEIDKTSVIRREIIPDSVIKGARDFLKEYFNTMDVPSDEDSLIAYVLERFTAQQNELSTIVNTRYSSELYPGKEIAENALKLCDSVLVQKKDNTALLKKLIDAQDELLDSNDDMAQVYAFFKGQHTVFDRTVSMLERMKSEQEYLIGEREAQHSVSEMRAILEMKSPYRRISELPGLMQQLENIHGKLLSEKREQVKSEIQAIMAEVHQSASITQQDVVGRCDEELDYKKKTVETTESLTALDAMRIQLDNIKQRYIKALIVAEVTPDVDIATANRAGICMPVKLETEDDIDRYVADIKSRLMRLLDGHDVLHLI